METRKIRAMVTTLIAVVRLRGGILLVWSTVVGDEIKKGCRNDACIVEVKSASRQTQKKASQRQSGFQRASYG
jgi:hypothetical protein